MAEGEGPQERAQGGRGHHPMAEDLAGGPGAQDIAVVDAVGPGHHDVHQGDLATGSACPGRSPRSITSLASPSVPGCFDSVATRTRPAPATARSSSKVTARRVGVCDSVCTGKMPLCCWWMCSSASHIFPTQGAFPRMVRPQRTRSGTAIRVDRGLGATPGKVKEPILQRCVFADFAARSRAEKSTFANEACHRRHAAPDLDDQLRSKLIIRTDGPRQIPSVEQCIADSHPQELRARDVTHHGVGHCTVERAKGRESGALLGSAPFPLCPEVGYR